MSWHAMPHYGPATPGRFCRWPTRTGWRGAASDSTFDLNSNWDVSNAAKMPEITAQRKAMLAGGPAAFFFSLHNTETSEYLEGPPNADAALRAFAERLSKALEICCNSAIDFCGPVAPGRMTVIHRL